MSADKWHLAPQLWYVRDRAPLCRHVLRQENLTEGFNALMKGLGLPPRLPLRKSGLRTFLHILGSWGLPVGRAGVGSNDGDNRLSDTICPQLSVYDFDNRTRTLAACIYRHDYAFFGYHPDVALPTPSTCSQEFGVNYSFM